MTERAVAARTWEGRSALDWQVRWRVPEVHLYHRVGSTNDVARGLAEAGAPPGTVVLADEQTAGRGRGGRRWHAPAGKALLLSMVLRPRLPPTDEEAAPGALPLLVGLAVARAIDRVAGTAASRARPDATPLHAGIKWPNDVVFDGRKLAGILCEGPLAARGNAFVIAGVGVNVAQGPEDWPPEIRERATSLHLATTAVISRAELAAAIIGDMLPIATAEAGPMSPETLAELASRDVLRGRRVAIDGRPCGEAMGISRDGALLLRTDDTRTIQVRAGSVRILEDEGTAHEPIPHERQRDA